MKLQSVQHAKNDTVGYYAKNVQKKLLHKDISPSALILSKIFTAHRQLGNFE